jgi:hypothetical protein
LEKVLVVPLHTLTAAFKLVIAVVTYCVDAPRFDATPAPAVDTFTVAPVKSCVPVQVSPLTTLAIAVVTNFVLAALVALSPAVLSGTIIALEKVFDALHVLIADFKLVIAVPTKAVDATAVVFVPAVFVKTRKSNKVDADDVNVKFVELPIESVIIAGARNVKRQLKSFASILVVSCCYCSIFYKWALSIIISNYAVH